MRMWRSVGIFAAIGLAAALGSGQQASRNGLGSQTSPSSPTLRNPIAPMDMSSMPSPSPALLQEQAKMRNVDRQKQLVLDTQRLLALANELKTDVDKTNKDTLSLDVIRKADEIEKLAHSVKEKMKAS